MSTFCITEAMEGMPGADGRYTEGGSRSTAGARVKLSKSCDVRMTHRECRLHMLN